MLPLTLERPKPLVEVSGKAILAHILDALPEEVDEVVLVVGYKREMIQKAFGDSYNGRKISYVVQERPEGSLKALACAKEHLAGRFMVLNADDIHGAEALKDALQHPVALIVSEHAEPQHFGVVAVGEDGTLREIVEKPSEPPSNLVSTGAMVLDDRIFSYDVPASPSGEYYLPDALQLLAKECPAMVVVQPLWLPVGRPEDIPRTEEALRNIERKDRS